MFKKSDVFQQEATPGGSAQTYHGMLEFLDQCPPAVLVYENSDEITHPPKGQPFDAPQFTNADQLVNDLNARQFEVQTTSNDSPEDGVPNSRLLFTVALKRSSTFAIAASTGHSTP